MYVYIPPFIPSTCLGLSLCLSIFSLSVCLPTCLHAVLSVCLLHSLAFSQPIHSSECLPFDLKVNSFIHSFRPFLMNAHTHTLIHSFIQIISIAPLQVHVYSEALPTQHGYCAGVSRRSATGNCGLQHGYCAGVSRRSRTDNITV